MLTKQYGTQLTDEEIKTIINQVARDHQRFITKKIEEEGSSE